MGSSIEKLFYTLAIMALLLCLIILGAPIMKPLVFALFFSIMLIPIQSFFSRFLPPLLSVFITIITVLIPLSALVTLFFYQSTEIFDSFGSLTSILLDGLQKVIDWVNTNTPFQLLSLNENLLKESKIPTGVIDFLSSGLSTTVNTLTLLFLTLLFLIFFMWYRPALVQFVKIQFPENKKTSIDNILKETKKTLIKYLAGLGTVMVIMSILNSIGLTIIGVEYAVFFGVLAALLTIVPYLGTTLGGTLPFLFVIATGGGWLQGFAVVAFYFTIQQIEGNFITPKIVGESVRINPFAAIVGISVGTFIWGVAGIILAIPILGIVRIVCTEFDPLKPVAFILSNKIAKKDIQLSKLYDVEAYRLSSLFSKK